MGTTVPGALPYPEPTDPVANGAANFKALAEKVDLWTLHTFANGAARDAWTNPPTGVTCITLDDGVTWRRLAAAWSRLSPLSGFTVGSAGSYPAGTEFCTSNIAADPGPRLLTFNYNAIAVNPGGGTGFMEAFVNGAQKVVQQLPVAAAGVTNIAITATAIPIPANTAITIFVRVTLTSVSVQGQASTHGLWWKVEAA